MSLRKALQEQNFKVLKDTVDSACEIYNATEPSEPQVETAFGSMPISAIYDDETKWQIVSAMYSDIVQEVNYISSSLDLKIETAKLIATSPELRWIVKDTITSGDDLL